MSGIFALRRAAKRRPAIPPAFFEDDSDTLRQEPERWTRARDAKILARGATYRGRAALAEAWGLTSAQVLARWHLLRAR